MFLSEVGVDCIEIGDGYGKFLVIDVVPWQHVGRSVPIVFSHLPRRLSIFHENLSGAERVLISPNTTRYIISRSPLFFPK